MKGKSIIVCAPSGSGKTTIVNRLLEAIPELSFSISATSRDPREGEKNGVNYYFLSADEFKSRIQADAFLEWEEVYENQFYGTLKSEIERIWSEGKTVIFDVDVEGGVNLKKIFGNRALSVFIRPPSIADLEKRLRGRGTESEESLNKRLSKSERELSYESEFDQTVVNDVLDEASDKTERLVKAFLAG